MGRRKHELRQLASVPLARIHGAGPGPADEAGVAALAASLERQGLREPPLVIAENGGYRVVVGRARLLAAQRLGWPELSCIVLGEDCRGPVAEIERLEAGRFDPWALAEALETLKRRCDWTQAHIGLAIGRTRDFVTNILAINNIRADVRAYLTAQPGAHELTTRHLRYIGRTAPDKQMRVARRIVEEGLSTKQLEGETRRLRARAGAVQLIKVRALRKGARHPRTLKEWRKYYRQLTTDLKRIDRKEADEQQRVQAALRAANARARTIRTEAREKRKALRRELGRVRRHIEGLQS